MQHRSFWQNVKRAYVRYDQFMEKQGFYVVLCICLLTIALSALYTFHFRQQWQSSASSISVDEVMTAGVQEDEVLSEVRESLLVQSQSFDLNLPVVQEPFRLVQPVEGVVIRDFSILQPQLFEKARYWRVHPGIDIQAEYGTPVKACASGKVSNIWEDHELGLCVSIQHEHGYETFYAGLSDASYVQAGDPVVCGQTIAHVGNGVAAETDAGAHLHFEARKAGSAIDPVQLFLGVYE